MDPRHQYRIKIIENLFAYTFEPDKKNLPNKKEKISFQIIDKITEIDKFISQYALKFPVHKIAKADLAILRWAIYELKFSKKLPPKVVINEAIELAKELSGEKSFAFVNAILGKVL